MKRVIAGIGSTLLLSLIIISAVISNKENKVVYQGYGDTYHLLFNNRTARIKPMVMMMVLFLFLLPVDPI